MAVKKVDLCIVGGSAAGMSAALVAKRKGVKDVLILEKMASTGGTARMTDGIMAIGSQTQRDLGLYYDIDQFYKDVMTVQDWHCDAKLVRKWLSGTAASMELLESIGMHYGLAVTETADINRFRRTRHVPVTIKDGKLIKEHQGPILVKKMLEACQKEGVEILCKCRAEHVIQQPDGRVTGVKADWNGEPLEVEAGAVILATGSISHNRELVKELYGVDQYGDPDFLIAADMPWNTGDGYYMAREAGGAQGRVAAYYMGPHNHFDGYSEIICCLVRRGHSIQVNRNGERFCDEALMTESEWGWMKGASLDCQPGRVCYTIMDEAFLRKLEAGEEYIPFNLTPAYIDQPMMRPGSYYEENFDPTKWRTYLRDHLHHDEEAGGGRVAIVNTIAEAAQFIGCDEAVLQETIDRYNSYCALKHDDEFLKDPKYLHPVVEAPFYVMRGDHCIDTAIGGVAIDHRQRVVDSEGRYIPGLYAAGVMCSGWSNGMYVINCAAMSYTVYSGRAAAEEAAAEILS